ncbi:MAG: murein biosynthesis integral membrane protein MurJ [Acidobacteriota bacterium]
MIGMRTNSFEHQEHKTGASAGQSEVDVTEHGAVLRSAGTVGLITLLSRFSGYLRDMVIGYLLGTGMLADAWVAAFRLPNTLRRLVGEGNVSAAFVPVFADETRRRDQRRIWQLADSFHAAILVAASGLMLLGIAAAPWLVRSVLVPGFGARAGAWDLTAHLARITFPYLLFISLSAALMAILNARDRFAAPAFTPVLFNLALIACALSLSGTLSSVNALAAGAIVGGFLQWLFLVPFSWRLGMRFRLHLRLSDPAMRRIGLLMVPGLFGVGITQINVLVGQLLASFLRTGSISSLYYAGRLNELTLGVFAISVATVVLPLMSRQAARGDREQLVSTLNFALRQVTLITLPAAVGLILLRSQIVDVLFQRGLFNSQSTDLTAAALWGYSCGLIGYAAVRIIAPAFYALKDTRTPVIVAAVAMVANVVGCLILMQRFGHVGIALANSLAGYLNTVLLLVLLRRKLGRVGLWRLTTSFLRLGVAAAVMGWVVSALSGWWKPASGAGLVTEVLVLAAVILVGVLTYLAAAAALRAPELAELRSLVLHGKGGSGSEDRVPSPGNGRGRSR